KKDLGALGPEIEPEHGRARDAAGDAATRILHLLESDPPHGRKRRWHRGPDPGYSSAAIQAPKGGSAMRSSAPRPARPEGLDSSVRQRSPFSPAALAPSAIVCGCADMLSDTTIVSPLGATRAYVSTLALVGSTITVRPLRSAALLRRSAMRRLCQLRSDSGSADSVCTLTVR